MSWVLVKLIGFYQRYLSFDTGLLAFLAPGGACKYEVHCSEYAKRMILRYGVVKGIVMGVKRIWSCR